MSISAYQQSIFKSRAIPLKATQSVEERQLMALEMASSQLTALITQMTESGELSEEEAIDRELYLAKKTAIQNLMTRLGTGISVDISDSVKSVTEETTALMELVTGDLVSEDDQEVDLSNFAGIPQTVLADYASRVDVEGLKISPDIWANNQTALIENQVMSAIVRGQSAISLAQNLEKFVLGGSIGMGHSIAYKTMRLARTEINTAYHESRRLSAMASPVVQGMVWKLSNRHPKWDVCDLLAEQDLYGMGQGVYPSAQLPPKPHPNCICYTMDDLRDPVLWDSPKPAIALKGDPSQFRPKGVGTEASINKQYQMFDALIRKSAEADERVVVSPKPIPLTEPLVIKEAEVAQLWDTDVFDGAGVPVKKVFDTGYQDLTTLLRWMIDNPGHSLTQLHDQWIGFSPKAKSADNETLKLVKGKLESILDQLAQPERAETEVAVPVLPPHTYETDKKMVLETLADEAEQSYLIDKDGAMTEISKGDPHMGADASVKHPDHPDLVKEGADLHLVHTHPIIYGDFVGPLSPGDIIQLSNYDGMRWMSALLPDGTLITAEKLVDRSLFYWKAKDLAGDLHMKKVDKLLEGELADKAAGDKWVADQMWEALRQLDRDGWIKLSIQKGYIDLEKSAEADEPTSPVPAELKDKLSFSLSDKVYNDLLQAVRANPEIIDTMDIDALSGEWGFIDPKYSVDYYATGWELQEVMKSLAADVAARPPLTPEPTPTPEPSPAAEERVDISQFLSDSTELTEAEKGSLSALMSHIKEDRMMDIINAIRSGVAVEAVWEGDAHFALDPAIALYREHRDLDATITKLAMEIDKFHISSSWAKFLAEEPSPTPPPEGVVEPPAGREIVITHDRIRGLPIDLGEKESLGALLSHIGEGPMIDIITRLEGGEAIDSVLSAYDGDGLVSYLRAFKLDEALVRVVSNEMFVDVEADPPVSEPPPPPPAVLSEPSVPAKPVDNVYLEVQKGLGSKAPSEKLFKEMVEAAKKSGGDLDIDDITSIWAKTDDGHTKLASYEFFDLEDLVFKASFIPDPPPASEPSPKKTVDDLDFSPEWVGELTTITVDEREAIEYVKGMLSVDLARMAELVYDFDNGVGIDVGSPEFNEIILNYLDSNYVLEGDSRREIALIAAKAVANNIDYFTGVVPELPAPSDEAVVEAELSSSPLQKLQRRFEEGIDKLDTYYYQLPEDVRTKYEAAADKLRSEEVPISMNIPLGKTLDFNRTVLDALLTDGRLKNLFETGTGEGSTNQNQRSDWERNIIASMAGMQTYKSGSQVINGKGALGVSAVEGLYDSIPIEDRPVYGAFNIGRIPDGASTQYSGRYNNSWLELENHVKDRTTMVAGNSSAEQSSFVPVNQAEKGFVLEEWDTSRAIDDIQAGKKEGYYRYVEAQVWGGVDLARDVKAVHITIPYYDADDDPFGMGPEQLKVDMDKLRELGEKYDIEIITHQEAKPGTGTY